MNYDLRIFAAWAQLYPARCAREKLRILTEHKTITIYELRITNYELRITISSLRAAGSSRECLLLCRTVCLAGRGRVGNIWDRV